MTEALIEPDGSGGQAYAFYRRDGDRFAPTGLGVSPWNRRAQMGVGLAGLIVHTLLSVPVPAHMFAARLTIDILGPVPMEPMTPVTRVAREGRSMRIIDAELRIADRVWVRASALCLRMADQPAAATTAATMVAAPPAAGIAVNDSSTQWSQMVRLAGDYDVPGPGAAWVRIFADVVAGETITPLEALAMVADFGSGIGPVVPLKEWTFANVDISLHLTRPPQGAWLLIEASSESAGKGVGLTSSRLGDGAGPLGWAHQTTFLERRDAAR